MIKEVEVGDEFTGKVVKTTTFGAFVELVQGHRRPAAHLQRRRRASASTRSRTCSTRATRSSVRVVEVDRERGRIGLRLADDPDDRRQDRRGARHGRHGRRRRRRRRPRPAPDRSGGARRARPRPRATAARAAPAARGTRDRDRGPRLVAAPRTGITELDSGVRVVTERMPSRALRGARLLDRHRLGRRGRARGRALAPDRAHALPRHRRASRRARSTRSSTAWAPSSTPARARRPRRSTRACSTCTSSARFDVMADMVWRPRFAQDDLDNEREIVLEEIAMYEDDPQDKVFDILGEAVFGIASAGPRDHRARPTSSPARPPTGCATSGRRATCRATSSSSAAGSVDHDALVEQIAARPGRAHGRAAAGGRSARRASSSGACASSRRTPSSTTSAWAAPASRATTTAASRCASSTTPRRHVLVAPVPGGAREARAGLLGLLVPVAVRRHRPGRALPRHAPGQRRRGAWPWSPTSSSASAPTPATAEELERSKDNVKGRLVLALESTTARMNRLGSSVLADCPCSASTRWSSASTP